jgi:hypothetical protein
VNADDLTGVTFVMLVLTFLFVPETARLTLEQIDEYFFSGRVAWKTSTHRNKMIAKGEIVEHSVAHEYPAGKIEE